MRPEAEQEGKPSKATPKHGAKLSDDDLYRQKKREFLQDAKLCVEWHKQARNDFAFKAGEQWGETTKQTMGTDGAGPPIVFNMSLAVVQAVAGIEINGRHETTFLPRGTEEGDIIANEVLSGASQWMADECDAEDEQSGAFEDACDCGMGWCLSGDAMVRLPNTHFATTRLYDGAVIEIDLENGQKLTGTPNHPVLTDGGWKPLHAVHEGDNLINSGFFERVHGFPVEQFDKVEARLEDEINAFRAGREAGRFATAADDFYADGAGSKVHIVYADGPLLSKFRDTFARKKVRKQGLVWRDLASRARVALFGYGMHFHPVLAAEGQLSLGVAHSPGPHVSRSHIVPKGVPRASQADAHILSRAANKLSNLFGGEHLLKVKAAQFLDWGLWRRAFAPALPGQNEPSTHQSGPHGTVRYSDLIGDFFDWKPVLEVHLRQLRRCDGVPAQFMTRVTGRAVKNVQKFPVHDVGTSLGLFVAANIITSNTETRIDWDEEPDGKYIEESVSPLEMFWDHRARKKNLADARRVWRARKMTRGDARDLIEGLGVTVGIGPGAAVSDEDLHCPWAVGEDIKAPESVDKRRLKLGDDSYRVDDDELVTILHGQWLDYEPFFLTVDADGSEVEMSPDDFKEYRKAFKKATGQDVPHVRQRRQVRRQAFIGGKILFKGDLCRKGPDGETRYMDRFTFNCITGHLNKTKGTWFGLITVLRDPQMLVNKTLSKVIHILSTTAQGGVLAEKGAFGADIGQAQRTYAKHNKITEVADGAIREGRIMAKPGAGNIAPFASILEYAVDSLWRVAGTSPELLGMKDVNQPGVLEAQRKQSSMTILAKLFDSLRRFRKNVGRNRLYYIQNFLSDGRIVRITGDTGKKAVRLIRENTTGQYDVIVDDAPTSPNQKEQTFQLLMQLMPFFKDKMTAEAAMVFLEHSPLPAKVVAQFKEMLLKPNPQAEAQGQIELRGQAAEVAKTEAETEKIRSETREKEQAARANAVMDMANVAVSQAKVRQANVAADHTGAKAARDVQNWQREDEERAAEAAMMPTVPELPEVGTQPVAQPSGQPVPIV